MSPETKSNNIRAIGWTPRIARIRSGLYNYLGYNLYRCKGEWVILDADNAAIAYAPRRADLVRIIDRMEQQPEQVQPRGRMADEEWMLREELRLATIGRCTCSGCGRTVNNAWRDSDGHHCLTCLANQRDEARNASSPNHAYQPRPLG